MFTCNGDKTERKNVTFTLVKTIPACDHVTSDSSPVAYLRRGESWEDVGKGSLTNSLGAFP